MRDSYQELKQQMRLRKRRVSGNNDGSDLIKARESGTRVLFVCTGNAGRSQIAEALFKQRYGQLAEVFSAGVDPWDNLHPMAVKLLAEQGIDPADQYPKHVRALKDEPLDVVVTIGDRAEAEARCFRTGAMRLHWNVADPADADGTPRSETVFRKTMAAIADRLPALAKTLRQRTAVPALPPYAPAMATCFFRPPGLESDSDQNPAAFQPDVHLPMVRAAGFAAIELTCYFGPMGEEDFPWRDPGQVKQLRNVAKDHGVAIRSTHAPELRLNREDAGDSDKLEVLKRFRDLTLELAAEFMVVHYFPAADEDGSTVPECLETLADMVKDQPLLIALETLQQAQGNHALISMFEHLPASSFGMVLDTGHCHVAGDLDGMASRFGRRLKGLHLHDNDGTADQHVRPGLGTIDWVRFGRDLVAAEYEGPLTLEFGDRPRPEQLPEYLDRARHSLGLLGLTEKLSA